MGTLWNVRYTNRPSLRDCQRIPTAMYWALILLSNPLRRPPGLTVHAILLSERLQSFFCHLFITSQEPLEVSPVSTASLFSTLLSRLLGSTVLLLERVEELAPL